MVRSLPCVLLLVGAATAQTTWIVETGNPAALPSVAAAVAAASDGDIILIRDTVAPFLGTVLINKSLRIVGAPAIGGSTLLFTNVPSSFVVQVAAHQSVTFSNLQFGWALGYSMTVLVDHCAGPVTFQDVPAGSCAFRVVGSDQVLFSRVSCTAVAPVLVDGSTAVFSDCNLTGQSAVYESFTNAEEALSCVNATVQCMNSVFRGGAPNMVLSGSLPGTRAATITTSDLVLSGSTNFLHGQSAATSPILSTQSMFVLPSTLTLNITGTATTSVADLPTVDAVQFASGHTTTLTVRSPLGSIAALVFGVPGNRLSIPGIQGDLWIDLQSFGIPVAGVQNGALQWQKAIPASPALFGSAFRWQGVVLSGTGLGLGAPGGGFLR